MADVQASLSLNGTEIDTGTGSAVMGDPAEAVAWLANALSPLAPRSGPESSSYPGHIPPRHLSNPAITPAPPSAVWAPCR
ncbi:putative hydratase/decarboxylase [Mycobacterium kansasii]|uniref:Putative hydratase/decarboxylase n=1 Tax=Mycobacterium kansasii TaxID=1768 RepID=A0A1V3Y012_MYCKA|nr:putative hydratase/decarboxylase [Mycobacterium kansasii]